LASDFGTLASPHANRAPDTAWITPEQLLDSPQTLRADPELPGFVLDRVPVWRP
jgi:hypothetical protein